MARCWSAKPFTSVRIRQGPLNLKTIDMIPPFLKILSLLTNQKIIATTFTFRFPNPFSAYSVRVDEDRWVDMPPGENKLVLRCFQKDAIVKSHRVVRYNHDALVRIDTEVLDLSLPAQIPEWSEARDVEFGLLPDPYQVKYDPQRMSLEEFKEFLQEAWVFGEGESKKDESDDNIPQMARMVQNHLALRRHAKIEPIGPMTSTGINSLDGKGWRNVERVEQGPPETDDDDEELWEELEESLSRLTSSFVKLMKAFLK